MYTPNFPKTSHPVKKSLCSYKIFVILWLAAYLFFVVDIWVKVGDFCLFSCNFTFTSETRIKARLAENIVLFKLKTFLTAIYCAEAIILE